MLSYRSINASIKNINFHFWKTNVAIKRVERSVSIFSSFSFFFATNFFYFTLFLYSCTTKYADESYCLCIYVVLQWNPLLWLDSVLNLFSCSSDHGVVGRWEVRSRMWRTAAGRGGRTRRLRLTQPHRRRPHSQVRLNLTKSRASNPEGRHSWVKPQNRALHPGKAFLVWYDLNYKQIIQTWPSSL